MVETETKSERASQRGQDNGRERRYNKFYILTWEKQFTQTTHSKFWRKFVRSREKHVNARFWLRRSSISWFLTERSKTVLNTGYMHVLMICVSICAPVLSSIPGDWPLFNSCSHLGSLTAANWVSFDFNVSYSSCWGYSLLNTLKLKKFLRCHLEIAIKSELCHALLKYYRCSARPSSSCSCCYQRC